MLGLQNHEQMLEASTINSTHNSHFVQRKKRNSKELKNGEELDIFSQTSEDMDSSSPFPDNNFCCSDQPSRN